MKLENKEPLKVIPSTMVHNLWPIPVYESQTFVQSKWLNTVLNTEYERRHNDDGDISKDRYLLNSLPDLKKEIISHCESYVRIFLNVSANAKFNLLNSWAVRHNPGDNAEIHSHGNSLLSGVYYLKTTGNTGNLVFHKNPLYTNTFHQNIRLDYDETNSYNTGVHIMNSSEGRIFIFPSHLDHGVEKNESNEQRYSLAFNFFVKGIFGEEEYVLELK